MNILVSKRKPLKLGQILNLPKTSSENGLVEVELDKQNTPRHHGFMIH